MMFCWRVLLVIALCLCVVARCCSLVVGCWVVFVVGRLPVEVGRWSSFVVRRALLLFGVVCWLVFVVFRVVVCCLCLCGWCLLSVVGCWQRVDWWVLFVMLVT